MSELVAKDKPPRRCRQCGAPWNETAQTCWLCSAEPSSAVSGTGSFASQKASSPANPWLTHGAIWLAVVVAAVVGYGVFVENVLVGLMYLIAVAPPILIPLMVSAMSRSAGRPVHPLAKVAMGAGIASLSVPLALAAAVLAVIIGLFQICSTGRSPLLDFLNR